ncbi:reverse transcriptase [Corchorus capsularis]|uniref:RNA-directed DNA polymerase n=1 Tax=Corchorus capsularis TaxID=210143 RepID=A0A1R3I4R3_COCAP|nr:reverse transcriptase [Corchorus capsularis]
MAAQVRPTIGESEIFGLFIDTQKSIFYDKLFNMSGEPFAKIVVVGLKLDNSIKSGKIVVPDEAKKGTTGKKKEEVSSVNQLVNNVGGASYRAPIPNQQSAVLTPQPIGQAFPPRATFRQADQYTYSKLLPQLVQQNLVRRVQYQRPLQPPFPAWYDVNAYCDFHCGAQGHSTENCLRLKQEVQALVKSGKLNFPKVEQPNTTEVQTDSANITGIGGMTRSGRCYSQPMKEPIRRDEEFEKGCPVDKPPVMEQGQSSAQGEIGKPCFTEKEALENLDHIVGSITAGHITFTDEDIPEGGRNSLKALYISVGCNGFHVGRILIDNGSTLNIMSYHSLEKLSVDLSYIKPNNMMVRAFDGTTRSVRGDIEIQMEIGGVEFLMTFQVMDISPSYSCLLGRPWIHMAGAVPSTLHQAVKFRVENKLIEIKAEKDIRATQTHNTPYVEATEESVEDSYRSFEVAEVTHVKGGKLPRPHVTKNWMMQLKQLVGKGWKVGCGLGKRLQGIGEAISTPKYAYTFGLGFKPVWKDRVESKEKMKQRRIARLKGEPYEAGKMEFPPLYHTFRSAGWENSSKKIDALHLATEVSAVRGKFMELSVNAVEDGSEDRCPWIYPAESGSEEVNWTEFEFPVVINNEMPTGNECKDEPDSPANIFERPVCNNDMAEEYAEDSVLPSDLMRLIEQEDRQIQPHKESTELINLGTEENRREMFSHGRIRICRGLNPEVAVHRLPIRPECKPVQQNLRRMKPDMLLKIKEEVKKQFDAGFLEEIRYPEWQANIVPVPKNDGKVRMCVDYRYLNRASPKDNFPLPHIDILVDNIAHHSLFSFMDGFSGYNQIKMAPEDKEKTAFVTAWGTFFYKVMPFGLKNAGSTYQRAMVTLFHDMMHKEIELKLNPSKCTFGATSGKLLGFVVSQNGIKVDPDKVRAIQNLPPPRTQKEVRGFLGRLNYIARFISQLTAKCDPIFKLLRKNNPERGRPLILYLTVFEKSMGCVLAQQEKSGRKEHAVYYLSKKFTEYESNYSPLEKMCCALAWAAQRLRQYMLYHTTMLVARLDPLRYIFVKPGLSGRIARWQVLLSEYDIVYVSQKAIKGSVVADFLADRASNDYEPVKFEFPDEDLMAVMNVGNEVSEESTKWNVYFYGASNMLGHGIGAVLVSPDGDHFPATARLDFPCTNNIAEYVVCVFGIQMAIEKKVKVLEVNGDSALVVYQMKGEWEKRDSKLIPYREYLLELMEQFEDISFHYVPREGNQLADALASLAAMFKFRGGVNIPPIKLSLKETLAHVMSVEEEPDGNPWYYDIVQYLKHQKYPEHATGNDKRVIRRMSLGYFLDGEVLYKSSRDQVLLRCVNSAEAKRILEEVHEGICGSHASRHKMARQVMRAGYYWLTLETDCINYARRCHQCQIHADQIHTPPNPLHVLVSPWPFSMWGIDVIGAINPKASNGHQFILVAIDYFTKWVEASSYSSITQSVVLKFIKKEIICRYGLPERIITDNAMNLNGKLIAAACAQFKITHSNSAPRRPKMNGAVEAANKNIKNIIRKMTETYRDWHEKLPFALHAYRTCARTSTGATPYSLVYGMEAVVPIEVEIPSSRVYREVKLEESEWEQERYDQLNLLGEKRMNALCHGQAYQKRMIRAFNKKVHPRQFKEGELVLKKILSEQRDPMGKWAPNWEGPYVVKKAFSGGALILQKMDGDELPSPINSNAVKKYYA